MQGKAVVALAWAHRGVLGAEENIKDHDNVRLVLIGPNDREAAMVATHLIEEMQADLASLEAVLVACAFSVRLLFDGDTMDGPNSDALSLIAN